MLFCASPFVGCGGGSTGATAQAGAENGPCYGNGTCNEDLTCASHVCVRLPGGGDASASSGGRSSNAGGKSGGGGSRGGDSGAAFARGSGGGGGSGNAGGIVTNAGGSSAAAGTAGFIGFGGLGQDASTDGSACSADVYVAERVPLDLYFVVDKSGSMDQNNKWQAVTSSLVGFLNDPASADIGVGIGYFPYTLPGAPVFCCVDADCLSGYGPCVSTLPAQLGCDHPFGNCQGADSCQVSSYATPAVPLATPPDHPAVVSSIQSQNPGGGTPTSPAVQGALQYVTARSQAIPDRTIALVLVTDGDPSGCTANTSDVVANMVAAVVPIGIKTFVIGIGTSLTSLNLVAQSGGTGQAYVVDAAADVGAQISDALSKIHAAAHGCTFQLPTAGQSAPSRVNVTYSAAGAQPVTYQRTPGGTVAECGAGAGSWGYDDVASPARVTLCPPACAAVAQLNATVKFEIGCATFVPGSP